MTASSFPVPPSLKPRDRYVVRTARVENGPGVGASTRLTVLDLLGDSPSEVSTEALAAALDSGLPPRVVGEYVRNYSMMSTFEPFRQLHGDSWSDYALVSLDYTRSAVLDLATGALVAQEDHPRTPSGEVVPGAGFCPVEFFVPDWWDVHDGSILPGTRFWGPGHESPRGLLGFVSGCHWGDDSAWKLQVLDLSFVLEGVLSRDDRFGYVPVAGKLRDAVSFYSGSGRVSVAVELDFDLASGALDEDSLAGLTDPSWRSFTRPGETPSP